MDSLESLWQNLSLSDSEEFGISCPKDSLNPRFLLVAKFLTKQVDNIDSVARTFKPLCRTQNDFKIKEMGDNTLFFDFKDEYDLQRVVEHESWTYDKHLVIFERVRKNVPISDLRFQFTSFWIQIHDLPIHCLTPTVRKSIGRSLGKLLHKTDFEEEGGKGNYL